MASLSYTANPARVVFGVDTTDQVGAEAVRLGASRVLLLSGPRMRGAAQPVRDALGSSLVAEFDKATMHTPVEVTEQALDVLRRHRADCLVAIGGGSVTGLAKALALRTDLPQVVLPTTYAGSEMTPVLGETAHGLKVARSDPAILPETVIYDVRLTLGLPVDASVHSAVNALAHAVEALYSPRANPVVDSMALGAISRIGKALPRLVDHPDDLAIRSGLLQAAWLSGSCLGAVPMGLHHKLCHVLGGAFGLPHAETHAILLPHVMAYNAPAAADVMTRVAAALGVSDAVGAVFDLAALAAGPGSLSGIGLTEGDIAQAVRLATAQPYPNPRPPTADDLTSLLDAAWRGDRPGGTSPLAPDLSGLTAQVLASFDQTPDPRTKQLLSDAVRHLHEFTISNELTQGEWQRAVDFLTDTGHMCSATRQEFVLLSDTLGVSSVVDALSNSRVPRATSSAVLGPFYTNRPPERDHGADIAPGLAGTPMWANLRIVDTEDRPVAGAQVDVWQANSDGFYDVQLPEADRPTLRARFTTDGDGRLAFWSIVPSPYPIPDDGPVGRLLASVGRHPFRAAHVHFMINAPGHRPLITQLFVKGGPYLDSTSGQGDTVFGVKDDLIVEFPQGHGPIPRGRPVEGEWRRLDSVFRVAPAP